MTHTPTVLILDNDPLRVITYEEILKQHGLKPFSLTKGDDFLYYQKDLSPCLILIDYQTLLQEEDTNKIIEEIQKSHVLFLCDPDEQLSFPLAQNHQVEHYPLSLERMGHYLATVYK